MSFLHEIKRRKIFQVAAVYAVVAWLLVQVVVAIEAPLRLPGWTDTLVIVCLAVGFPITLVVSWAFNLTSEGFVRDEGRAAAAPRNGKTIELALIGALAFAVIFVLVDDYVWRRATATSSAGSAAAGLGTGSERSGSSSAAASEATWFEIAVPADVAIGNAGVALSPDGRDVVFVGVNEGGSQLYHRSLAGLDVRPMPGTEGAAWPFFSPDGRWVAFVSGGEVKRVALEGGPAVMLFPASAPLSFLQSGGALGQWAPDEMFLLAARSGLLRVAAGGGERRTLELDASEEDPHVYLPGDILPDDRTAFVSRLPWASGELGSQVLDVAVVSLETGEVEALIQRGASPRYVPSGHLMFYRENAIWAAPFDPASRRVTSEAIPVLTEVDRSLNGFDIGDDGSLVVLSEPGTTERQEMVWVDREGREEPLAAPPRAYSVPHVSPSGNRVAVAIENDIWILDRTLHPLTSAPGQNGPLVWSPNGERIAYYASGRAGGPGIFIRAADGTGQAERITSGSLHFPTSWSPDGRHLAFVDLPNADLYLASLGDDESLRPLAAAPDVSEFEGAISPNGRWLAFESERAGNDDIWVQAFPEGGRQYRVSANGGFNPVWARDDSTLFFLGGNAEQLMSVEAGDGAPDTWGAPQAVMPWPYDDTGGGTDYDVGPDGRFLALKPVTESEAAGRRRIVFVENWVAELKRRMPTN